MSRLAVTLTTCIAVGALLSGCGDRDDTAGQSDPSAAADGLTAPGSDLTVGDTATVPVGDGGTEIALTVESIDVGSSDLLPTLDGTPYFVRLKATVVKGDGHDFFAERFLTGFAGDDETGPIQAPLTVGACTRTYFEVDPPVGTSIEPCLTMMAPGDEPIDRVAFAADGGYQLPDDAVTWTAG